jgi:hypothetical protein
MRMRSVLAATAAILVSALVGGVFGSSASATDKVPEHYRTFTTALNAIQSQYAETVEPDRLVYGAINGMLQTTSIPNPTRRCANARKAATTVSG